MRTDRYIAWALVALGALAWPAAAAAADQKQPAAPATASETEPFGRLTLNEVEAKMKEAKTGKLKLYVFDNNSKERYQQSHLPGAKWVNYEAIQASDLPADKEATLVFYCANEH